MLEEFFTIVFAVFVGFCIGCSVCLNIEQRKQIEDNITCAKLDEMIKDLEKLDNE